MYFSKFDYGKFLGVKSKPSDEILKYHTFSHYKINLTNIYT